MTSQSLQPGGHREHPVWFLRVAALIIHNTGDLHGSPNSLRTMKRLRGVHRNKRNPVRLLRSDPLSSKVHIRLLMEVFPPSKMRVACSPPRLLLLLFLSLLLDDTPALSIGLSFVLASLSGRGIISPGRIEDLHL
jgi:hypothetical protein